MPSNPSSPSILIASRRTTAIGLGLVALAFGLDLPARAQDGPAEQRARLEVIESRIQQTRSEALQREAVQREQSTYIRQLRNAMIEEDAKAESLLRKQDELVAALNNSPDISRPPEQRSPEFQQSYAEYQLVHRELQPIAQAAADRDEVVAARAEYEQRLFKEMTRIDENIERLLNEREQLVAQMQTAPPARQ